MKNNYNLIFIFLLFFTTVSLFSGNNSSNTKKNTSVKFKNGKIGKLVSERFRQAKLEVIEVKGLKTPVVIESLEMSKQKNLRIFKQGKNTFIKVDNEYYYAIPSKDLVNPSKEVGYCVKCRSKRDFKESSKIKSKIEPNSEPTRAKPLKKGTEGRIKSGKRFIAEGISFKKLNLEVVKVKGYKPPVVKETKEMSKKKNLKQFTQNGKKFIKIENSYYEVIQDPIRAKAKEVGYCVKCRSKKG